MDKVEVQGTLTDDLAVILQEARDKWQEVMRESPTSLCEYQAQVLVEHLEQVGWYEPPVEMQDGSMGPGNIGLLSEPNYHFEEPVYRLRGGQP